MHYILVLSSLVAIKRLLWHLLTQNRMQCTSAPRLTTGISNSGTALHINSLCVRVCGWSWVWCLCMPQPAPTSVWFYSQHLTTPTDFGGGFSEVLSQLLQFFSEMEFLRGKRNIFWTYLCIWWEKWPTQGKQKPYYLSSSTPANICFFPYEWTNPPLTVPPFLLVQNPHCLQSSYLDCWNSSYLHCSVCRTDDECTRFD